MAVARITLHATLTARSSFVLDLTVDGKASACRGRRVSNMGPGYQSRMAEQQGFSGTWAWQGNWLELDLALDDATCAQQRGYTNLAPTPWKLRCQPANVGRHDVLACQFAAGSHSERTGYQISTWPEREGEWLLLGAGDGVSVSYDYDEFRNAGFKVEPAMTTITADAWTR